MNVPPKNIVVAPVSLLPILHICLQEKLLPHGHYINESVHGLLQMYNLATVYFIWVITGLKKAHPHSLVKSSPLSYAFCCFSSVVAQEGHGQANINMLNRRNSCPYSHL